MTENECSFSVPNISEMHKTYSVDFNEQKKLFIHAKILNEKFSLTEAPCIDSGSFLNLVPLRLLTGQIHNLKKAV